MHAPPDYIPLPAFSVLRASGEDARTFIDGQFSQSVTGLADGDAVFGAFCNPKGRALALARITAADGALLLAVDSGVAKQLVNSLSRYIMRARVSLASDPSVAVFAAKDEGDMARSWPWLADDAGTVRLVAAPAAGPDDPVAKQGLELRAIRAGVPRLAAANLEQFVPQMLNLDLLAGISFEKGCYTGQEIVARMQNLGTIKRRMLRFFCPDVPAPDAGTALFGASGAAAGRVVAAAPSGGGTELLAVVRLAELAGGLTLPGSGPLSPRPLPYRIPELPDS